MRWRTPREGDERTVRRFAWLPVELTDQGTVWLEKYVTHERLVDRIHPQLSATCGFGIRMLQWTLVKAWQ